MRFRRLFWGVLFLAVAGWMAPQTSVHAQEPPAAPEAAPVGYLDLPMGSLGGIAFYLDAAGFRGPEGYTTQELYVLLDATQLQFVPEGGHFVAQLDLSATVTDSVGQIVKKETWTRNISIQTLQGIREVSAPWRDIVGFSLMPGDYSVTVTVEDMYGDKRGTVEGIVRVKDLWGASLANSDILFASEAGQTEESGRFVKSGWHVTPNTTRRYLAGTPMSFYFELYNLSSASGQDSKGFVLGYSLVDTSGNVVKDYPARRFSKPGDSCVKADTVSTEGVAGGLYYLQIEAFDRDSRAHIRTRRKVWLASGGSEEQLSEAEKDQLRFYSDIRYVAQDKDLKILKSLSNQDARMKFLRMLWKKLDPTPETPINERLIEHMRRMQYTENNFSGAPGKKGSDTHKGRVYIKYGPPDDIEYNMGGAGSGKPYEVWTYERQGRYTFTFRDRRGLGIYELVHSTYPGELSNPNWEEEL